MFERVGYLIRYRFPAIYRTLNTLAGWITANLYHRSISAALQQAYVEGKVKGEKSWVNVIGIEHVELLENLVKTIPQDYLTFFHPHGMDHQSLEQVLKNRAVLTYGIIRRGELIAYVLLKLFPGRKAYIGRLVRPEYAGIGLGKFLSRYLCWQCYLMDFRPYSTIHPDNVASLKSHAAVRPYTVVEVLHNGFYLIRFELTKEDEVPPKLEF